MVQDELLQNTDLDELESLSVSEEKIETRRLRPLASFLDFDVSRRPTQAGERPGIQKTCLLGNRSGNTVNRPGVHG